MSIREDLLFVVKGYGLTSQPDRLVVGTGRYGRMAVPEETLSEVAARGVEMDAVPTADAVALFNKLAAEPGRRVVAAFHLTC